MSIKAVTSRKWGRRNLALGICLMLFFEIVTSGHVDSSESHAWARPGCYRVGHTRRISLPGCVEFDVTTNACRGFCESYSVPSSEEILRINSKHVITSHATCCDIIEAEDVPVSVICFDGPKHLVFKSAKACSCYHCKKD